MVYAQQKNMDRVAVALPGGALEHGVLLRAPIANSPPIQFDYRFMSQDVADRQGMIDAADGRPAPGARSGAEVHDRRRDRLQSDQLVSAQEISRRYRRRSRP